MAAKIKNRLGIAKPMSTTRIMTESMIPPARHGGRKRSIDVREVLPTISVPTLVMYRRDARIELYVVPDKAAVIGPAQPSHTLPEMPPCLMTSGMGMPSGTRSGTVALI